MDRRVWLSVGVLLVGGSLLFAAAAGRAAPAKLGQGGTLRLELPWADIDDVDPSLAYGHVTWALEYSTALKLFNYPDAPGPRGSRLIPEGATAFKVSNSGRTYTFTIRKGFRFSDGSPVTAANYAFAINRALGNELQSPAFQFVADEHATNVVGAQDVRDGRASDASGVRVRGNKLTITLTEPDGTFLSKISMPFFQALPLDLSRTSKVIGVDESRPLPSAGPYYVTRRTPSGFGQGDGLVVLKRNPYYAQNVGRRYRRRPAVPDRIHLETARGLYESYEEVKRGGADYSFDLPPTAGKELEEEFGLMGRFRIRPSNCINYIAMNTSNRLFRNNPRLRRAVNYVLDRRGMAELGNSGGTSLVPTDQYLPRGFPGFENIDAYPFSPNVAKARALARGHVPSGRWIYYYGLASPGPQRMALVRTQLAKLGIDIDPHGFRGFQPDPADKRNSPHAFVTRAWCQDYSDPFDFINTLLYGGTLKDENNNNVSYFDSPAYNSRMERAAKLTGDARLRAYTKLEHDLVTKAAPWAAWAQPANQFFFGDRVDMRSFVYQPIYETPPFNALALK